MKDMHRNYEQSQVDRMLVLLPPGADYVMKIKNRTTGVDTKWLSLTDRQVRRIADIIFADGDMFDVQIRTDNAAFDGLDRGPELARILRELADRVDDGETDGMLRDVNGNTVGSFTTSEE